MKLDLNLLVVFDAVMTERHVTRAAARLGLSQPSVSNALNRLRDVTGDALFVKVASGVAPTRRAIELWEPVRASLARIRDVFDPAPFEPARARQTFAVALTDYMAALFMPPLIAELSREAPGIDVRLIPNTNVNVPLLLDRGEIDMALGLFPNPGIHHRGLTLLTEHYVCVMRRDHPLTGTALTIESYAAASHLVVSLTGEPTSFVDHLLRESGLTRRIALTVNQFFLAPLMVSRSNLIATLTYRAVAWSGLQDSLHLAPLPIDIPPNQIRLLWHERHHMNAAHRWLRTKIQAIGTKL